MNPARPCPSSRGTAHGSLITDYGSRITRRSAIAILLLAILTVLSTGRVAGGETAGVAGPVTAPVLSGCEFDYPPYCIVTPDNQADGFSVELMRAALKAVGREVTFKTGLWSEIKQDLTDGRLQALPMVARTPDRDALFEFTFPYLTMHGTIVVRKGNTDIHTLADLNGRQVAELKGDYALEYLKGTGVGAAIVPVLSYETALRELSSGKHDAVVIQQLLAFRLMQKAGITNLVTVGPPLKDFTQSFCFAVRKGDTELLAVLNEGLAIVMADGTFRALHAKWFSAIEAMGRTKSRIVVGGDCDYPPYEFLDRNGQPAGCNVDLTRAIARQMGLSVDVHLGPWDTVRKGLAAGNIDVVQGMFYSVARDREFHFSPPDAVIHHVIVVRKGTPVPADLKDLAGKAIVVMAGDIMEDLATEQGYGKQLVAVPSQRDALRLLAAGKYDCALVAKVPALYWIAQNGWCNLRVSDTSVLSAEYCYAAPRGNEELLSHFSEGLAAVKATGEYRRIQAKWLSPYETTGVSLRMVVKYVLVVCLPLLALLAISFFWSRSLQRQVANRTRELSFKTALLEAQSEATIDGILVLDGSGRTLLHNTRFGHMWRIPADILVTRDDPRMLDWVLGQLADPEGFLVKVTHLCKHSEERSQDEVAVKDGRVFDRYSAPLNGSDGICYGRVWYFRDVSEQKRAAAERQAVEIQMRQQQKLAAVGTLARGVAHEINNPIMGVINYAQLIQDRPDTASAVRNYAGEIVREGERVAGMVRHLLSFAEQQKQAPRPCDPAEIVNGVLSLIRTTLKQDRIEVVTDIPEGLPNVECQLQQMQHAVMNLLSNARDSLNERYPGHDENKIIRVTVRESGNAERGTRLVGSLSHCVTKSLSQGPDEPVRSGARDSVEHPVNVVGDAPRSVALQGDRSQGRWVRISVEDHGLGVPAGIAERIMEPFFTTKDRTQHSGLGLAFSRATAQGHGGKLSFESEPGQYARFHIDLPCDRESVISNQ